MPPDRRRPTNGVCQLELLVDAGQAGGDQRREGEIGVEVGAADAALDADALGALAAEAEAGGAVVAAPDALVGAKVPTWKRL